MGNGSVLGVRVVICLCRSHPLMWRVALCNTSNEKNGRRLPNDYFVPFHYPVL